MACKRLLHLDLVSEPLRGIFPLQTVKFLRCVLIQELVDAEEASTHSDVDLVLVDLDHHTLRTELINTFGLAHEHDLKLLALRIVVNVLSNLLVNLVILHWDVHRYSRLQVNNVRLQIFNRHLLILELLFNFLQLLEQLKTFLTRVEELGFDFVDVVTGGGEFRLQVVAFCVGRS